MRRSPQILLAATALAVAAWPAAARADCQPAGPIAEALAGAEVAFVGQVLAVQPNSARVTFRVVEAWKGSLGATVEVRGISDGPGLAEDDRTWERGATYLVIPFVDDGVLRDHLCTATTSWRPELAALRPAGVEPVDSSKPDDLLMFALAAVAVAVLAAAAILLIGRGDRPKPRAAG